MKQQTVSLVIWMLTLLLVLGCGRKTASGDQHEFPDLEDELPEIFDTGEQPANGGGDGDTMSDFDVEPPISCDEDPCIHGRCDQERDRAVCICDEGYGGQWCDGCADGYHVEGLICAENQPCATNPCVFGTCRDDNGQPLCLCDLGYDGAVCDECASGYHVENLRCVPDEI